MESTAAPANAGSYNTSSKNSNTSICRVYFKFLTERRSSKSSHICVKRVRIEVDTESLNKNPWLAVPSNGQEKDVMFLCLNQVRCTYRVQKKALLEA